MWTIDIISTLLYLYSITIEQFLMRPSAWISLFGTFHILRYPIELQGMFFWQKNKYFQKMPTLFWISKKPNWVPAEWCWQLRFESTMGYFADILTRFSEFCQNDNIVLSNLSRQQHSAVLNLASLVKKPWKEMWAFFEKICFSARMSSWNTSNYPYILSSCGSLLRSDLEKNDYLFSY